MKVRELIELLNQAPQDLPVRFWVDSDDGCGGGYEELKGIHIVSAGFVDISTYIKGIVDEYTKKET